MDQLFVELIGKPKLNPAKIITIIAENFSLLEDQAKFLKAVLAIPYVTNLQLDNVSKRLIQLGPLHSEVGMLLTKRDNWIINKYHDDGGGDDEISVCDKIAKDFLDINGAASGQRSLIFINDVSKILLSSHTGSGAQTKFLRLIDSWKRSQNHFVVALFQQSQPISDQVFLHHLEYISDACIRNRLYKNCYMQSIWFQPLPSQKSLIPPKVETQYYTCKIGKYYWMMDLLCFHERNRVSKTHDPDVSDSVSEAASKARTDQDAKQEEERPDEVLKRLALVDDEDDNHAMASSTLPYVRAQNPEQSRIFYYPDKDDDIDEDDPDNDLNF